jgi:hypothetical protein
MKPPRYSLRTLLVAVALVSVAMAIWHYLWPDPNNTLPIAIVLPPEAVRQLDSGHETERPSILFLKPEQAAQSGSQRFQFALVNPTEYQIKFVGYRPDSYSVRPRRGTIHPLYSLRIKTNGGSRGKGMLWCGTGSGELLVIPGHAGRFDATYDYSSGDDLFQVGVECQWTDETGRPHKTMIWSDELSSSPRNEQ